MTTRPPPLPLHRSNDLLARARRLIPGITSSMMKRPDAFAPGESPVYLARGDGAVVWDVDGNRYVDFVCGLGANALGHGHPAILEAIGAQLPHGVLHSLPTQLEIEVTEAALRLIPGAEMARTFKTGADATSAAVRLARHLTGKAGIVTVGYNGWHDHFMVDTPGIPPGVAQYTTRIQLHEPSQDDRLLETVERDGDRLAAVLLSVPYGRVLSRDFLVALADVCRRHDVRFVLDEIVTGFRLAPGGAQAYFDVQADLACFSKALGAGLPISMLTGPRRYLQQLDELQVSTTFGGETLALAACRAALTQYATTDAVARVAERGRRLRRGLDARCEALGSELRVVGYDAIPCFRIASTPAEQARRMAPFVGALARRGFLLRRDVNFICSAHTDAQIDALVDACGDALEEIGETGERAR